MIDHYLQVRARTEAICSPLQTEDYVPQPEIFTSPPKWHLAHTSWFFEEFVLSKLPNYKRFHPQFAYLFNSYYNTVGPRVLRANRGLITRPSVSEVYAYRSHVDKHMKQLLKAGITADTKAIVEVGINHEQQHQELLITDLKFTLSCNPINPVYENNGVLIHGKNSKNGWLKVEEGIYPIGHNIDSFCYDNEQGHHQVFLQPFEISHALVTNAEFIQFIEAGGYQDVNLWLDVGWAWVKKAHRTAPLYWQKINGEWHHFTLGGLKKVIPNEVVCHVSFYEASAYAQWQNMRLPTEFEWEAASEHLAWGQRWEWTNSAYLPYPNYKKAAGALGEYNGKFMINQMVLRGASVATSPKHSRKTYRNFFHPHYQWQFSGIRLAR